MINRNNYINYELISAHEEPVPEEEVGVRMLFNIVDPTGLLGSSSAGEMALNGLAKIIGDSLSTAKDLQK